MKKRLIALVLSFVLATGSVGAVPVFATETTTEEAMPVEEEAAEEQEKNEKKSEMELEVPDASDTDSSTDEEFNVETVLVESTEMSQDLELSSTAELQLGTSNESVYKSEMSDDPLTAFRYRKIETKYNSMTTGFTYNHGMLLIDSNAMSTDLAKASVALAMQAYRKPSEIEEVFEEMEYEKVVGYDSHTGEYKEAYCFNYDRQETLKDNDFVGYSIAKKYVTWQGEDYVIYCVPVRGTHGDLDWYSNFLSLGNEKGSYRHKGFYLAAEEVIANLDYIMENDEEKYDSSHTILWTTGHSRGAAIANIVAGEMTDRCNNDYTGSGTVQVDANHIFGYTFACPYVSKKANESYENIYNFNNKGDLIPIVPLKKWGYLRYGQERFLEPGDSNFLKQFQTVYGAEYGGASNTVDATNLFLELIPSDKEFYTPRNLIAFTAVAHVLDLTSGGTKVSYPEALLYYASAYDMEADLLISALLSLMSIKKIIKVPSLLLSPQVDFDAIQDYDFLKSYDPNGEKTFKEWRNENFDKIKEIENRYDLSIESPEELEEAIKVVDNYVLFGKQTNTIEAITKICLVYLASDQHPLKAVAHGHTGETYICWINSMFYGENGWANNENLNFVSIPAYVNSIGNGCFKGCSNLKTVELQPSGNLNYIGRNAFESITALTEIKEIDKISLYAIGEAAFKNCSGFSGEFILPNSVIVIGRQAFYNCTGLTKVTLPVDVGYNFYFPDVILASFYGCSGIKEIHYTAGWTGIMPDLVPSTDVSTESHVQKSLQYCVTDNLEKVTFDEGVTRIGALAFKVWRKDDYKNLTTVVLPESLEEIGEEAFENCKSLNEIALPRNLKKLGVKCFYGCSAINKTADEFGLPASLAEIPRECFYECSGLTGSLTIPDNITRIDRQAFYNCSGLTKVTLPVDIRYNFYFSGDIYASFYGCSGIKEIHYTAGRTGITPDLVPSTDGTTECHVKQSLQYCVTDSLEKVTFDEGVTRIGAFAFKAWRKDDYKNLATVVLPESLEEIGEGAFENCKSLNEIALPRNLNKLGVKCFYGCSAINKTADEFGLPASLAEIPRECFYECSGLTGSLTIPDNITRIDRQAFYNCSGLTKVTLPVDIRYNFYFSGDIYASFYGCSGIKEIHYTAGRTGITPDLVPSTDGTTECHVKQSLQYCVTDSLEKVTFDEGVTRIGALAFKAWRIGDYKNLTTVVLPESLEEIGDSAFNMYSNPTIYSYKDSFAESYAGLNNIPFVPLLYPILLVDFDSVETGESYELSAKVCTDPEVYTTEVLWSVSGNQSNDTIIDQNSKLVVAEDESAGSLKVSASYNDATAEVSLEVIKADPLLKEAIQLINLLPENLTDADEEAVIEARTAYEKLSDAQKTEIPSETVEKLTSAEDYFATAKEEVFALLAAAISSAESIVDSGVTYTDESYNAFTDALQTAKDIVDDYEVLLIDIRKAYEALTESQNQLEKKNECQHLWDTGMVKSEPTCTKEGSMIYTCTLCGEIRTETIPVTEHLWMNEYTVDREATCTEEGTRSIHCAVCGQIKEDSSMAIPMIGHDWDEGEIIEAPICTEDGIKIFTCRVCEETKTETLQATGHQWNDEYTIDKEATCTEDGSMSVHCFVCDDIKDGSEEEIPAKGHTFGEWEVIASPTGSEQDYEQRACDVCGYIETRNINEGEHEWEEDYTIDKEPTCTEEGSKSIHCKNCDAVKDNSTVSIPASGHFWDDGDVIVPVTCTENGEKQYTCQNCGETRTETVSAAGHQWRDEYTVDKEATCKEEGSESIHCAVCGTVDEDSVRVIGKKEHVWDAEYTVDKQSSCMEVGLASIHCSICGEIKDDSLRTIDKTPHIYGDIEIVKAATCMETGSRKKICTVCGDEATEEIPANGHIWNKEYTVDREPTNSKEGSKSIHCSVCNVIKEGTEISIPKKENQLGKTTRGDMFNLANNVKVTWKEVPGAKYYKVYREGVTDKKETRTEPVIVTSGLVGWDKDPGLTNGHAYRYRIVASLTGKGDPSGDSPLSYSKLMYRLKTVVIRSVKNTAPGKVTVKYDKTTSGDSYVLQYCERQDMVGAKTKVVLGANNTSYTIGGLKKGKTYYISIRVRKKVNGIDYYTTFGVPKKVTISK